MLFALNVAELSKLTKQMRYEYSEPRQLLISEISANIATHETDDRFLFSIDDSCAISQNLDWLKDGHIRKNSNFRPPFTYFDALFLNILKNVMIKTLVIRSEMPKQSH